MSVHQTARNTLKLLSGLLSAQIGHRAGWRGPDDGCVGRRRRLRSACRRAWHDRRQPRCGRVFPTRARTPVDLSTGTVGYYLRCLGPAVLSRRPLVIDLTRLEPQTDPSPAATADDPLVVVLGAGAAVQVADAQLVTALAHLLARDDGSSLRDESREEFAHSRTPSRTQQYSRESVSQEIRENTDSLTREPREESRELRAPVRAIADDDEDLDELVAPLVELCERLHLVGVTNRSRLRRALSRFQADQIRYAVRLICTQVRAGVPIRSPVGLLVRLAEADDTTYFVPHRVNGTKASVETCDDSASVPDESACAEMDTATIAALRHLPVSVRERLLTSRQRAAADDEGSISTP
jgi:hypothetical protein